MKLVFAFCIVALTSFAKQSDLPQLYDVNTHSEIESNGNFKPNRVYTVFEKSKNAWYFAKTNSDGVFASPKEYYRPKTVLPGLYLGAKNILQNFELDKNGEWKPTVFRERQFFTVMTKPQTTREIAAKNEGAHAPAPPKSISRR